MQHYMVNSLGWNTLRPLQEQAVDPSLVGDDALLIAPTASGKTEAAVFPALSRMLVDHCAALSILYVCPLKALLNNLAIRLRGYTRLIGRHVEVWHGDVGVASDPGSVVNRQTSCWRLPSPSMSCWCHGTSTTALFSPTCAP
jgi:ATP-dependent Lhr-like helicase